ncbi:DUF3320 domain-containing protein [Cereibacter sphaeroides]|uniref:DUF3320 domain-containing protein n=1 Tax=Cereibacter sphaeroides TaxID=1063 RepID=UPI000F53550A|nr:DUF3320 domain-containing protein [Cereibacter sphaeroides]AZB65608.1 DUF3320 domain-containing protein [Cereibacter sphaeroides]AZB70363.1 DUF3320 domain-containing protein [Cereibacter sphaeroides]
MTDVLDLEADASTNPVEAVIHLTLAPKITFASHQNDIPVLLELAIENASEADLDGLMLSVTSEPQILGERTWTIDRIGPKAQIRPRDLRIPLAGGLLDKLTDRMKAEVRFILRQGDKILADRTETVTALARNEWGGGRFMPELLAAFVTPNDPSVQRLLKEASVILAGSGKSGSLEGYQAKSRARAWEIMAGIWAAVSARGITYAVPPASFEQTGQKIRLPSEIAETGLATCLDTALLFAAAFEQAGLHPVVIFTKEHAFAGAWLQPQYFPTMTVDDAMVVRKAVALKELVLFETTMAAAGHPLPFTKAIAEGERRMAEEHDVDFAFAIDIRQARRRGIQPLSSILAASEAAAERPALQALPLDATPDLPPFDQPEDLEVAEKSPEERLAVWRRSLLDLSKANRLLNLKPSATAIPIFCPDPGLLEDRIAEGKRIKIIPAPVRRDIAGQADETAFRLRTGDDWSTTYAREALERGEIVANTDEKSLERGSIELYRKAKADIEEGGSNTLFLALGQLRWSPSGDAKTRYSAPMILLPVRLERASARSRPYLQRHDDEAVFNLTLLQMLRQDFGIDLPELAGDLPKDASGIDVKGIWNYLRIKVKDVPGFEVVEEVILSTFSFAKYLMWKDLTDRTETLKASPFVRHLIDTPRDPYAGGAAFLTPKEVDAKISPAEIFAPLNADSSQIVAIHASGQSGDFVLEGPPGTGKSETIGNIIAHNLALGRRVLFVSEKMAALDVVYRRLVEAGLGDFCLELHSARANKQAVLSQLDAAWTRRSEKSAADWAKAAGELSEVRGRLNRLVEALHRPGPAGVSPRDAMGRAMRFGDLHRLELDWPKGQGPVGLAPTPQAFAELQDIAKRLGQRFAQVDAEDHRALSGIAHADWSFSWQTNVISAARKLAATTAELLSARSGLLTGLGIPDAPPGLAEAQALAGLVQEFPTCLRTNLGYALTADTRETLEILRTLAKLASEYRQARAQLAPGYADDRLDASVIARFLAERAEVESRSWLTRGAAQKKLRAAILAAFGPGQVEAPEADLEALAALSDLRHRIEEIEATLPPGTPWRGLKTDLPTLERDIASAERLRTAVQRLAGTGRDFISLRSILSRALCEGRDMLEPGGALDLSGQRLARTLAAFEDSWAEFSGLTGRSEMGGLPSLPTIAEELIARERRLNPWCGWIMAKREAEGRGLAALVLALKEGAVTPDQTVEALRTAYCRWVAPELIDASPELRRFSAVEHADLIQMFRKLDRELSAMTADYIRAKLSSTVPAKDALQTDPGFGVLSRQLQRKVGQMPVRQLVAQIGTALTTLTPCLLMSPLSVAQFLPADLALFDLVVFDEASQITVPDAIGAIARGKRSIVVGDPRQMPPTRFFEKGAEDDENDDARDLESILDEALAARIPLHRLTGHYRSRHESLIAFSNHAYYKGELVTFPSADTRDSAVSFRKVDGIYAKGKGRTNPIEAQAVVAAVLYHICDPKRKNLSLGIVTLNAEQQRLIEDLLDAERRKNPGLEPFFTQGSEPIFVKNLETVQGDQRDVILISVCYGPTEPGAATMSMNFGPLNRKGGERRLNVAVTRATSEVTIFASFDPTMIDLTRTQAQAVRDLKHYLEFAARGPAALGAAIRSMGGTSDYDSDFEMAVAEALRLRGWVVRTQIGVSKFRIDLGIVHPDAPGRFLAGIECDGATYHSSPTARDRDRVRHLILERLGWKLLRVWSTDWFLDAASRIETLDADLQALLAEDRREAEEEARRVREVAEAPPPDDQPADDPVAEPCLESLRDDASEVMELPPLVATASLPPNATTEIPLLAGLDLAQAHPSVAVDPERFHEPGYRHILLDMARNLIAEEGPITFKRISDLIAREHGFQRTGSQISSTIWTALKPLGNHIRLEDGHELYWPDGSEPAPTLPFRGLKVKGRERLWKEVPLPERLGLVAQLGAKAPDDLPRAVADAIGYGRLTQSFRDEIASLVAMLDAVTSGSSPGDQG